LLLAVLLSVHAGGLLPPTRERGGSGLALYRYEHEDISLAKAAALAGVSWAQMKQIMLERGIQPRLGPETLQEAEEEVRTLRQYFDE
jgi:predicted HTH domain antitoxin